MTSSLDTVQLKAKIESGRVFLYTDDGNSEGMTLNIILFLPVYTHTHTHTVQATASSYSYENNIQDSSVMNNAHTKSS